MNTNEFLKKTEGIAYVTCGGMESPKPRPHVVCKDGYKISIQANEHAYCTPRENHADPYLKVELGYPNREDNLINDYAEDPENPTDTVYGYVPVEIVDKLLEKHGGIDHYMFYR